jgi:hypothetical protein
VVARRLSPPACARRSSAVGADSSQSDAPLRTIPGARPAIVVRSSSVDPRSAAVRLVSSLLC